MEANLSDVHSVHQDAATRRLNDAEQTQGQGRLAGTSATNNAHLENGTQDSGQVYSTQNYTWKYYIRITLQNNTSMLNKYGPDIIKNAEMHVGRPLLRS